MKVLTEATGPWPQPSADGVPVEVDDLYGMWTRSLIRWHEGEDDTTTSVRWLQSDGWYADLRQPTGRPDFTAVSCLRELTRDQLAWMFQQEGFAGRFTRSLSAPAQFTWERMIDWSPTEGVVDTGTLHIENGVMVERGIELPYLEHWHRTPGTATGPTATAILSNAETGTRAIFLRTGARFAFVRSRAEPVAELPAPEDIRYLDLATLQAIADCEVSLGTLAPTGWRIDASSLPYKDGLPFSAIPDGDGVSVLDLAPHSAQLRPTRWQIDSVFGDLADLSTA
ncbi:hypothetical protein [Nocardia sp. A7]|uniref:hypothetical protein n=1 Tax=Nocardia sp. A7 TaxID=2789274 RepID=UPI0039794FA7